ncbi:hypothetical protein DFJ74DRAFT_653640 [Hyaloraphidium curvatum]|nr:hypothetical protein DFJ74DRAFT_653640 [Hyaloraphidium curvatum]
MRQGDDTILVCGACARHFYDFEELPVRDPDDVKRLRALATDPHLAAQRTRELIDNRPRTDNSSDCTICGGQFRTRVTLVKTWPKSGSDVPGVIKMAVRRGHETAGLGEEGTEVHINVLCATKLLGVQYDQLRDRLFLKGTWMFGTEAHHFANFAPPPDLRSDFPDYSNEILDDFEDSPEALMREIAAFAGWTRTLPEGWEAKLATEDGLEVGGVCWRSKDAVLCARFGGIWFDMSFAKARGISVADVEKDREEGAMAGHANPAGAYDGMMRRGFIPSAACTSTWCGIWAGASVGYLRVWDPARAISAGIGHCTSKADRAGNVLDGVNIWALADSERVVMGEGKVAPKESNSGWDFDKSLRGTYEHRDYDAEASVNAAINAQDQFRGGCNAVWVRLCGQDCLRVQQACPSYISICTDEGLRVLGLKREDAERARKVWGSFRMRFCIKLRNPRPQF